MEHLHVVFRLTQIRSEIESFLEHLFLLLLLLSPSQITYLVLNVSNFENSVYALARFQKLNIR